MEPSGHSPATAPPLRVIVLSRPLITKISRFAATPIETPQVLGEVNFDVTPVVAKKSGKSVEDIYVKKTQLEHILLRPDTCVPTAATSPLHYQSKAKRACTMHN